MRYYFKYRVLIDLIFSLTVVILLFFIPHRPILFHYLQNSARDDLAFSLFSTTASLLGFVLAASTFLISHIQQPKFDILRSAKSYKQLPQLVSSSLWRLFFASITSVILPFVNDGYVFVALVGLTFVVIFSAAALAATLWVVLKIYSIPAG